MSIILITGSMFSEKTTTLLSYARKYKMAKKKVVLIKHAEDRRYSDRNICSHNADYIESTFAVETLQMICTTPEVIAGDVILIDEGQFFADLAEVCPSWARQGKHIVVSALNGTFERKPFTSISALIPWVNQIIHLSAVCTVCGDLAHFSHLKTASLDTPDEHLIGGAEHYEARCRKCLPA